MYKIFSSLDDVFHNSEYPSLRDFVWANAIRVVDLKPQNNETADSLIKSLDLNSKNDLAYYESQFNREKQKYERIKNMSDLECKDMADKQYIHSTISSFSIESIRKRQVYAQRCQHLKSIINELESRDLLLDDSNKQFTESLLRFLREKIEHLAGLSEDPKEPILTSGDEWRARELYRAKNSLDLAESQYKEYCEHLESKKKYIQVLQELFPINNS